MLEHKENLFEGWGQIFSVKEVVFKKKTEHQDLVIFDSATFGRVMALDGVIQTTEQDEFVYHEMLAHVPILAHGNVRHVLVIGGGDGAMLREVLKHAGVAEVTHVEIDRDVIDICERYLPRHSNGAFHDERVKQVIADGVDFVNETPERYDVIISDSTDPIGPGEALYTRSFYAGCHRCLRENGILVTQNGSAFVQTDEVVTTAKRLAPLFEDCAFYGAAVPTYVGGIMAFAWASDDASHRATSLAVLSERYARAELSTRYYTPEIHQGAFALPRFLIDAIEG